MIVVSPQSIACSDKNSDNKWNDFKNSYNKWNDNNCDDNKWNHHDNTCRDNDHDCEDKVQKIDLIAGGGNVKGAMDVGDVNIWNDADNIYVQYVVSNPWYLTEAHVDVKSKMQLIPQKNGNPIPGKFEYKRTYNYASGDTFVIPKAGLTGTVAIAVHGVVSKLGGLEYFNVVLPATATLTIGQSAYEGGPSYWPGIELSNGGFLNGVYNAWCANVGQYIDWGTFNVNVYSSYSNALPAGIVDRPENLKMINYIINKNYVGKASPGGFGTYTYGDVQLAIWTLIDNTVNYDDSGIGAYDQRRVDEIVLAAQKYGVCFKPRSGEKLVLIVQADPVDWLPGTPQALFIEVTVPKSPCGSGSETCWGATTTWCNGILTGFGKPFPGNNWATYLTYKIT